jgi:hypothetical protein
MPSFFDKTLDITKEKDYNDRHAENLGVAQLVARYLGVVEAAGSSPVTQTKTENQTVLRFFFVFLLFPLFFEIRASDFRARIFRFFTPKKRSKTIGRKNKWQASQKSRTALIW